MTERVPAADWWRQAVVYQIYPRSFADANGDGIGDLPGITSRVDYLAALGIDAVWLSPFYPSALADGGYDVDDYRDVDPRLGTLADFDTMLTALHAAGIKVIVDIVPNHTSDRHAWFQAAVAAGPGSPERERYIFRDGRGPDRSEPPSDWESIFGGPSWTRVPDGQWYFHLFAPQQPDLNWEHPDVRADFLETLRFWSDRGVDGFRIDVAPALTKDLSDLSLPQAELPGMQDDAGGTHPVWDRDEVHEIYASWRGLLDTYDPPRSAVAEAMVHRNRRGRYASPEGLGQAFNFDLLWADWDATAFAEVIDQNIVEAEQTGGSCTWVLSNHDMVRHASRYGLPQSGEPGGPEAEHGQDGKAWVLADGRTPPLDRDLGLRRARAATLLLLALPGSTYLYQGEELGLHEVADLPWESLQDPSAVRSGGADKGRDGCRVPLPWTPSGPSFGFGPGGAHLPQPAWFGTVSVASQEGDESSTLTLYRRALALRGKLQTAERLTWLRSAPANPSVLRFERPGGWQCVTNFGSSPVPLPSGEVLLASGPLAPGELPGNTTVWLRTS